MDIYAIKYYRYFDFVKKKMQSWPFLLLVEILKRINMLNENDLYLMKLMIITGIHNNMPARHLEGILEIAGMKN